MSEKSFKKPLAIAMGATFAAALSASPVANADANPFGMQNLSGGYMQLAEGMTPLEPAEGALACKYCGGGFGGYALHLFGEPGARDAYVAANEAARAVEPYLRSVP